MTSGNVAEINTNYDEHTLMKKICELSPSLRRLSLNIRRVRPHSGLLNYNQQLQVLVGDVLCV